MIYRVLLLTILLEFISCSGDENPQKDHTGTQEQDTLPAAQDSTPTYPAINSIENIQKAYSIISGLKERKSLDSSSFKYNCHDEKQGEVSYFTENGRLRLIAHRYSEYDHHSAEDYYYVSDSSLFFIYSRKLSWSFESGPQGSTRDQITEHRIYLVDQKPVRCLEKKFVIRSQLSENPSSETVPNQEVDCSIAKSDIEKFKLLVKYRIEAPGDCL